MNVLSILLFDMDSKLLDGCQS